MDRFDLIEVSSSTDFALLASRHGLDIYPVTARLSADLTERITVWIDSVGHTIGKTVQHTDKCQCGGTTVHHYMTRDFKDKICNLEWECGKKMRAKFCNT